MALLITGIVLVVLGILCCFINKVPGPVIAFIGMLLFKFSPLGAVLAWWIVIVCGVIAVASIFIIRMLVPVVKSKVPAYGKAGTWGTTVGSLLAVLFSLGAHWAVAIALLVLLPFVLAFLFELISQKKAAAALNSAVGAFAIFCSTTLIKLVICVVMLISGMSLMAKDVEDDLEENSEELTEQMTQAAEEMAGDVADYGF